MPTPIAPTKLRLNESLVKRLPNRTEEQGTRLKKRPALGYFKNTAAQLIESLRPQTDIWIFAAGSLIWNPRMDVGEQRIAHIQGWRRSFCLRDVRARGCPSAPGLMMSLDRGGSCEGVALQMKTGSNPKAALIDLLKKEPRTPPEIVNATTAQGPIKAILFVARPTFELYRPEPAIEELADILATAIGRRGSMAEYLLNTVSSLEKYGIRDPHLWQLQDLVAQRLEQLPENTKQRRLRQLRAVFSKLWSILKQARV